MASEDILKKAVADPVLEMAQRILDMRDGKAPPLFPRVEGPHSVTIRYGVWEDDLFALATAALQNNTRPAPADTDTGLETVGYVTPEWLAKHCSAHTITAQPTPSWTEAVVTRSQAEELLAAERAEKERLADDYQAIREQLFRGWRECQDLKADNAALTARVKELEEALDSDPSGSDLWRYWSRKACETSQKYVDEVDRAEALEAKLAAAEKALETYRSTVKGVCESQRGTKWGKAAECIFDAIERAVLEVKSS
ncbi:hypothetical protein [Brucella intermedia]|uniref:hypothetical protein n=1 Tax=Brucella intermedia TaxID=94625 RepID=UPI00128D9A26|nr:hypothetical protein [Brucella intermedia]